jgi:hypothetical protein
MHHNALPLQLHADPRAGFSHNANAFVPHHMRQERRVALVTLNLLQLTAADTACNNLNEDLSIPTQVIV